MTLTATLSLPTDQLARSLSAWADGSFAAEAAVELLSSHRRWLDRPDFRREIVDVIPSRSRLASSPPLAAIDWNWVGVFAQDAPCSSSERAILLLAASLAGGSTGTSLLAMTSSLDDDNAALALAALSHRFGWHQVGARRASVAGPCRLPITTQPSRTVTS